MKEKEAAALATAGILLSVALLRMLAPALPFDWMTLVLIVAAAAAIALPGLLPQRPRGAGFSPAPGDDPKALSAPAAMEALRARMAASDWQAGNGGLFDALRALRADKPFAAVCAARGLLMMLLREASPLPEDTATLSLLMSAIDELAAAGEAGADPRAVDDLFAYALRALGRFNLR